MSGLNVATNAFVNVGSNPDNYEVTQTNPTDLSRVIQLVGRITW